MQRYTDEIARAWHITFPPGSNPELQLMGHLWEPLKVVHKPLFVHIASEMSVLLTHLALLVRPLIQRAQLWPAPCLPGPLCASTDTHAAHGHRHCITLRAH